MTETRRPRTHATALWVAALLVLALPATAWAQGRLMGRVVNAEGEPIAGVEITVRSVDRGDEFTLTTDESGRFMRPGLSIGVYEVVFEKEGYAPMAVQRRIGGGETSVEVVLEAVTPAGPRGSEEYAQAFEAFQAGDFETTVQLLEPLAEDNPDFAAAFLLLGRSHFEMEHWEEAIAAYSRALELSPDEAGVHMDLGTAYVETGQMEEAKAHLERTLELQPEEASAHYNVGVVYFQANEIEPAVEHLRSAAELQPDNALAHKALAFALVRQESPAEAAEHLERYLELSPDAADAAEMAELAEQLRAAAEAQEDGDQGDQQDEQG